MTVKMTQPWMRRLFHPLVWWMSEVGNGSILAGAIVVLLGVLLLAAVSYHYGWLFQLTD